MNPLAGIPMSQAEIADLVERARAAGDAAKDQGRKKLSILRTGRPWLKRVQAIRDAVRYAHDQPCTLSVAARKFGVNEDSVQKVWRKVYPGVSGVLSKRSGQ